MMKPWIAIIALFSTVMAHADVTWEQARQAVSLSTGISETYLNVNGPSVSTINSKMIYWSVFLKSTGVVDESWKVSKSTGAICGYRTGSNFARYPLTSTWVWGLFPQFNINNMVRYRQNSDIWVYRSPQGILCTERTLYIEHTGDDTTSQIRGYEAVDLPLPNLNGINIVAKATASNATLTDVQNITTWAGPYFANYDYSCMVAVDEPVYRKDDFGVEWIIYRTACLSSPNSTVNSSWFDDDTKANDCVLCDMEVDAVTGQVLSHVVEITYSAKRVKDTKAKLQPRQISSVEYNGRNVAMTVAPLLYQGKCYIHPKYAKALAEGATIQFRQVKIGGVPYVLLGELHSRLGIDASYDTKLNKLDITTSPAVKKAK